MAGSKLGGVGTGVEGVEGLPIVGKGVDGGGLLSRSRPGSFRDLSSSVRATLRRSASKRTSSRGGIQSILSNYNETGCYILT